MATAEKISLDKKVSISSILSDKFMNELKKIDKDLIPINIIFIDKTKKDNNNRDVTLLNISHQSDEDIKNEKLYIECENPIILEKVVKIFEGDDK